MGIFKSSYGSNKIDKNDIKITPGFIDISKVERDLVPIKNAAGEVKYVVCHPKRMAELLAIAIDCIREEKTSFLSEYLTKPIILSYDHNTMWTDGNRIFANPMFVRSLINQGNKDADMWDNTAEAQAKMSEDDYAYTHMRMHKQLRLVKFVIIHECYHMFYNHVYRMLTVVGNGVNKKEWDRTNVATDLEINRDIECSFQEYKGCTEEIDGIWYKEEKYKLFKGGYMKKQICEEIYQLLKENAIEPEPGEGAVTEPPQPAEQEELSVEDIYEAGWNFAYNSVDNKVINYDDIVKLF